jgi:hypothetical protein
MEQVKKQERRTIVVQVQLEKKALFDSTSFHGYPRVYMLNFDIDGVAV